ncbi:MAG: acyltransferase family protein [Granulosicoccus sp.]
MKYRPDIDGLRAISVMAVIIFHSGVNLLSGGYVGVDIFFVISGYLITGLVFDEIKKGTFTFTNFYKRRIARLLPSLITTLLLVFVFGFLFYDNNTFDNLGKEIFFSAIGAANLLFAQGVNYFAQESSIRPLVHLWSLGVEEQFYLVWPTILALLAFLKRRNILIIFLLLFFTSLYMAVTSVVDSPITTYFYPQYRAFELITGAITALTIRSGGFKKIKLKKICNEAISYLSLFLIILPMFLLDGNSTFPGVNTLYPCIGTAMLILFSTSTSVSKILSYTPLVFIGLISYPLYLYHNPIISYVHFFKLTVSNGVLLAIVLAISIPLSWLTYRYIEMPIRKLAHKRNKSPAAYIIPLVASLVSFAGVGIYVAKSNGLGERFKLLNSFAYQVTEHSGTTFHTYFSRGMNISANSNGKILFVGDSLMQQYVYPISKALGIDASNVDTVTRGGCVLLKGVDFIDKFSDISCNDLRAELYMINTQYEYVVISQSWDSYDQSIKNIDVFNKTIPHQMWTPFINSTLEHFKTISANIIVIGSHLKVEGTSELSPTIFLSEKYYKTQLGSLRVSNTGDIPRSNLFFSQWGEDDVLVIHPSDIWSLNNGTFKLHDTEWSFFSDSQHASHISTEFVVKKIKSILLNKKPAYISKGQ